MDAYVGFINLHPHLYDLANGPLVAKADHPWLQAAAIASWDLLHDTIAACQPEKTSEAEVLRRRASAWGTVYGIPRLITLRQIPPSVPADQSRLLHEAVDTLYDGWQTKRR